MRDLFQVVFELKKKEIELARQQIQSKTSHHEILPLSLNIKASMNNGSVTALTGSKINNTDGAKAKVGCSAMNNQDKITRVLFYYMSI